MMWGYPDGFGWWMVFGGMWMIVFWAVVIGLIVWGVSRLTGGRNQAGDRGDTPLEIARIRLARGEITKEQFEEIKRTLQS
jgi:putative membrane protein